MLKQLRQFNLLQKVNFSYSVYDAFKNDTVIVNTEAVRPHVFYKKNILKNIAKS